MKRLIVLLIMMWMPFMSISQSLTPQVTKKNDSVFFCFTVEQSRLLAKLLEQGKYDRLELNAITSQNTELKSLLGIKDTIITKQFQMLQVHDSILNNTQEQFLLAEQRSKQITKQLKKKKRQNILLTVGIVVVSVLAIAK